MAAPARAPVRPLSSQSGSAEVESGSLHPATRPRRWLRRTLIFVILFFAVDYGFSILLRSGWLREQLTRRLESAFGRAVEVRSFDFSLLEGPRIEADSITVAEDPRFGNEYFLRADQLAVGLRWSALLRGRLELGTLFFTRPSLNLVRLPSGEWNLEAWLPRPDGKFSPQVAPNAGSVRLTRIEVSDGRINFKQGVDKLPFAFIGVAGSVEQAAPGSWRINLEAQPFRAAVVVQQAGTLYLSGLVGGTSSRLRPAALQLDWSDASLSDVLRLARGQDYGVRGLFSLQLAARAASAGWTFSSHAQLRRLHRWDLPLRADDPAVNVNFDARWLPDASRVEVTHGVIETPRSSLHASGSLGWIFAPHSSRPDVRNARWHLETSGVQLADIISWYRAFHPGVAEQVIGRGIIGANFELTGWPPRIDRGAFATEGIELTGGSLPLPIRVGRSALAFSPRSISLPPVDVAVGSRTGEFRFQGALDRRGREQSAWKLTGHTEDVNMLFASAAALGVGLPPGWSIAGPAHCELQWMGAPRPAILQPRGSIQLDGLKIRAPFLNQGISEITGAVNLSPQKSAIKLSSAKAFGASWHGTFQRSSSGLGAGSSEKGEWKFTLSADDLNAAEMDRWLNPQRRESLLDRVLPFLAAPPEPLPVPAWLQGRGTLEIGNFALAPFTMHQLRAKASIDGRQLELTDARAGFYGGTLIGSIALHLTSQPSYDVKSEYRNVNLSQLAARTYSLAELFDGTASGALNISATGVGRQALLHSLACRGNAQIVNAEYAGMDLGESMRAGARRPGITLVPRASAEFSCAAGQVHFSRLRLLAPKTEIEASGNVNFQQQIHLRLAKISSVSPQDSAAVRDAPSPAFDLTGTLNLPVLARALRAAVPH